MAEFPRFDVAATYSDGDLTSFGGVLWEATAGSTGEWPGSGSSWKVWTGRDLDPVPTPSTDFPVFGTPSASKIPKWNSSTGRLEWAVDDGGSLPPGGTTGQALLKASNSDGDADWEDVPSGASVSDVAYDATSWNGVTDVAPSKNAVRDKFETLGTASTHPSSDFDAAGAAAAAQAFAIQRANHTGTQAAATVSDFDTQVRTSRLDQMAAPGADVAFATHKITGLGDPTGAQDAASKNYVDGVVNGLSPKGSCKLATAAPLPTNAYAAGVLTATGFGALTVDGVAVAVNDRVLVKNEAAPANNGIYTVTATGGGAAFYVLTRSTDMNTGAEFPGAYTLIEAGTANADTGWIVSGAGPFTVGVTAVNWVEFAGAAAVAGYPPDAAHPNGFAQGYETSLAAITATSKGGFAQGYSDGAGSAIRADAAAGGFAQGYASTGGTIVSPGYGSFAQGYARNTGIVSASGHGAFAQGYVKTNAAEITASERGSFAQGYVTGGAVIDSSGRGSFAQGGTGSASSVLRASAHGSFAQGWAGLAGTIVSSERGAFAQGYALNAAAITSSGHGSFAQGYADHGGAITSSAYGSFAQGYAGTSQTIAATATNAAQFGVGSNAQADSLQVGNGGIRLLGKAAAQPQTTFQNGDIWVSNDGHVKIRSNGATISI